MATTDEYVLIKKAYRRICAENIELRELCSKMRTIIRDFDDTPYVTERPSKNPAVTWLEPDWEPIEECDEAMKRLGIEESKYER